MSKQVTKPTKADKTTMFIVLGFDEQRKPRGARYSNPNADVLIKAAAAIGLNLYEIKSPDLIKLVQALPVGRLLSNGSRNRHPKHEQKKIVSVGIAVGPQKMRKP
jgi:hypothetical protein